MTGLIIGVAILQTVIGFLVGRYGIHRHQWSKWEHTENIAYYEPGYKRPTEKKKQYERECETCGKPQLKKLKA